MIDKKVLRRYKIFHDQNPESVEKIKVRSRKIPSQLVSLGELREVVYSSKKWGGKRYAYVHKFKKPYPKLLTNQGGDQLYILKGKFRVKSEGIVG